MRSTNLLITSLQSQRTRQKVLGIELRTLDVSFLALIIKHISFSSLLAVQKVSLINHMFIKQKMCSMVSRLSLSVNACLRSWFWNRRDSECHEAVAASLGSEPWRWRRGNRYVYMSFLIGTRQYFTICLVVNPTEIRVKLEVQIF